MATVYSYVRFSSKKQELGDSVRRQVKAGDDWLAQHPEHTLDTALRLHDLGVSAFRGANLEEKGALGAFIALAKKPDSPIAKGSILLIERLDRFSRQQTRKAYRAFVELIEAGVTIQTLDPPQTISEDNIDDLHIVLPLVLQMCMAHEQSKEKSRRVGAVWHAKRENARSGKPMSRRCPSWLAWDEDGGTFVTVPDACAAVEYIFQRTIEGCGQRHLVTELNERFRPLGHSKKWNSSFVQKILRDRAVLGELQPHRFDETGSRVPDGEPIEDYYPRVISEEVFFAAVASKERRKRAKGRHAKFVNLFVGLMFGEDGHPLHIQTARAKGKGGSWYVQRRLMSYGHLRGLEGSNSVTVNYYILESLVLRFLYELDAECLDSAPDKRHLLVAAEAKVEAIKRRMQDLRALLTDTSRTAAVAAEVADALSRLGDQLSGAEADLGKVRQEVEMAVTQPLEQAKSVLDALAKKPESEHHDLRIKLRALISGIVERIEVKMHKRKNRRVDVDAVIVLRSGERRFLVGGRHLVSQDENGAGRLHVIPVAHGWGADWSSRLCDAGGGGSRRTVKFKKTGKKPK
jgi:DNA invertase Pin-like site-specific DNA recombinase